MSSYEHERYELHQGLAAELGPEKAATLMSYLPPVHWGEVATKHDLAVMRDQMATKSDLGELQMATKADFAELQMATKADFAELQMATKSGLNELHVEIANLETKLTAEIASWSRTFVISTVSSVLAAVALSFAAVHLR